jgi:hypothetical protein
MSETTPAPSPTISQTPLTFSKLLVLYLRGRDPMGFQVMPHVALQVMQTLMLKSLPAIAQTETTPAQPPRDLHHVVMDHLNGTVVLTCEDVQLAAVSEFKPPVQSTAQGAGAGDLPPSTIFAMPSAIQ